MNPTLPEDENEDDPPCWCGVERPYFSDDLPDRCGGDGMIYCICGGDFCVCHWHGEVVCDGCPDCDEDCEDTDQGDYGVDGDDGASP